MEREDGYGVVVSSWSGCMGGIYTPRFVSSLGFGAYIIILTVQEFTATKVRVVLLAMTIDHHFQSSAP